MELTEKQKQIKARSEYIRVAASQLQPGESITALVKTMAIKFNITDPVVWNIVKPYTKKAKANNHDK